MRNLTKGLILFVLVIFAAGCGVSVRGYKQVKDRVDQDLTGNAGYLSGAPQQVDPDKMSKTRTVYVVEFEKEIRESDVSGVDQVVETTMPRQYREEFVEPVSQPRFESKALDVPFISDSSRLEPSYVVESSGIDRGFTEYTLEKGDTLQKVSKKFYDTYRKWNKIFEANQDILKDPNKLKPGTVIKVPKL